MEQWSTWVRSGSQDMLCPGLDEDSQSIFLDVFRPLKAFLHSHPIIQTLDDCFELLPVRGAGAVGMIVPFTVLGPPSSSGAILRSHRFGLDVRVLVLITRRSLDILLESTNCLAVFRVQKSQ
jgi:hypothetical protein